MLFITAIISILTFSGSARPFKVLICEHGGLENILRGSWRPCTPSFGTLTSTIGVKNLEETMQLETIRKPGFLSSYSDT